MSTVTGSAGSVANPPVPATSFSWGGARTLDAFETLMWRLDRYPNLRSAVTGIEILDGVPDTRRVLDAHLRAVQRVPRLRQRLVTPPFYLGAPEWRDDPEFSVDHHLRFERLPAPGSLRQLLDLAQTLAIAPFDKSRPPWFAVMVEGLEGGRCAYILKIHHAMTDGIGIVQLLSALHSRQRAARKHETAIGGTPPPEPLESPARMIARQLVRRVKATPAKLAAAAERAGHWLGPSESGESRASRLARYAASTRRIMMPEQIPGSPLLAQRSQLWRFECMDVPLAGLRAAAKSCGASLNDAFVSAVLGGFRRYHAGHGEMPAEIPITFPISIRTEADSGGGNRFVGGNLAGPLGEADAAERMKLVGEQVERIRKEPALAASMAIMPLLAILPPSIVAEAMGKKLAANDIQISNVPGMRDVVYFAGCEVVQLYPFAPLPGAPAMIALVSHGTRCCIGLNLDTGAITAPDRLMQGMRESFEEILKLGVKS